MLKHCVRLYGEIINIGPWDYQYQSVEVTPAQYDNEGNETEPAGYKDEARNPLPDGAEIIEVDVYQDSEGAWRVVEAVVAPTTEERLAAAEQALLAIMEAMS